jgi:ferredoxin
VYAPAVATGIVAALKAEGRSDVRVLGQDGDGGTVDKGCSLCVQECPAGAIEMEPEPI